MHVEVKGINDTVRRLSRFDSELRKAVRKEFVRAADAIRDDARARVPSGPAPLSRWFGGRGKARRERSGGGFPLWPGASRVRTSVKSRPGRAGTKVLATVTEESGAAVVFDLAGSKSRSIFNDNLTRKWGNAPRLLTKTAEEQAEKHVDRASERVARMIESMWN